MLPADRGHPLQGWANRFGLGEPDGHRHQARGEGPDPDARVAEASVPGEPGLRVLDRTWKPGYSIQMAIGQGQILVTPLQMTRLYAMIANGGKLVTPHLADDVELTGPNGQPARVLRRFGAQPPQPSGVDPTALRYVQQGLEEATHSPIGTSSGVFGNFPVDIAGKTGSAEKHVTLPGYPYPSNQTQSWWCGYGPYDEPTIVVCALIENGGHGGTAAAPAALKVFEQYFGKNGQQHEPHSPTDDDRSRRPEITRAARPPGQRGSRARRRAAPARLGAARRARRDRRLRAVGDRRHHDARRGRIVDDAPGPLRVRGRSSLPRGAVRRSRHVPAPVAADLLRDARPDGVRARGRRRDARLEAVDRRRLLHVPAVRVRQGAVRPRARGLPRRARAVDQLGARDPRRARLRARADRARVRPAGHRHRARLHLGARRGPLHRRRALVAPRATRGGDGDRRARRAVAPARPPA